MLAAFFEAENSRTREHKRSEYATAILNGDAEHYQSWIDEQRHAERPLAPFHWEIEFPEVFEREDPGFDAFIGNPPFLKGSKISGIDGDAYVDWLHHLHEETHGNADLVAHFFRRAFNLVRDGGCVGLIATNTIGQGDTRHTGLRWICTHGGTIYAARRRYLWPGQAAVVVSVVWLTRANATGPFQLDGHSVSLITAYLFHAGGHENPASLTANVGKAFKGVDLNGMGFTFDDTDSKHIATPIAEMHRLIADEPRNADRIFPFIGGEEVNESPTQVNNRFVINFGDMVEADARRWPALMAIVEAKVKPVRATNNREVYRRLWWLFAERRVDLHNALRGIKRALVTAEVSPHLSFSFLPSVWIYAQTLKVFTLDSSAAFCVLQSRPHEVWARFFGSSMKDDLRYTPSDCFETFPFPENWEDPRYHRDRR